jgi:hypothetical protein
LLLFLCTILLSSAVTAQCVGGGNWFSAIPGGTLAASGSIFVNDTVTFRTTTPTFGGFNAGRPGYSNGTGTWSTYSYQSMLMYRGGGIGASTRISLQVPADSNSVHLRISDIRGDGINTEAQRVEGFLNGVAVPATFKDFVNGATVAGNIVNGAGTTTAATQSAIRIFFNGPIDSIAVTSTGFSDFVIIELAARCDVVLPQREAHLLAKNSDGKVQLQWHTNGFSYHHFVLERSNDQLKWSVLPTDVKSTGFYDSHAYPGLNFYRLRWLDKNGSLLAEARAKVNVGSINITLYSNPVQTRLKASFPKPFNTLSLYNPIGVQVYHQRFADALSLDMDCSSLPAGLYSLVARSVDGTLMHASFIKM